MEVEVEVSQVGYVWALEVCWVFLNARGFSLGSLGVRLVGSVLMAGRVGVGVGRWVSLLFIGDCLVVWRLVEF